jgi:Arc/MetJ-type ribon-helix-helix transcriptional regulator
MKRLSLRVTPEFERDLKRFMKRRGFKRKSDAIRLAVHEAAERSARPKIDFRALIGIAAKDPPDPNAKFLTEDDLWA